MEIQEIRKRIDEADEQLVQAFAKRMRAASDIADYKREHGLPVWDPAREREVMAKQTKAVDGDMAMYVKLLYNTILDISRSYQQRRLHRGGELGKPHRPRHRGNAKNLPPRGRGGLSGAWRGRNSQAGVRQAVRAAVHHVFQALRGRVFRPSKAGCAATAYCRLKNSSYGSVTEVYDLMRR